MSRLPLDRTNVPGVYRRGSKFVVLADSLGEAHAIKLVRQGEASERRRGPTLQRFSLAWLDRYAGSGHDVVREATRREYRRLLVKGERPHLRVRRAIVKGAEVAPKSRHGARLIPLTPELAALLKAHRPSAAADDAFVFPRRGGGAADQGSLRRRVLLPAAERAGLPGVGFHTLRHTGASMLIESGLSPLRLQRWMGHHSPAFTLDTYGHLIDGDLCPPLDLRSEFAHSPGHRR